MGGRARSPRPHFDSQRRQLWYKSQLVKEYRQPAANQVAVLAAFQSAGWPRRIDNPFAALGMLDPGQCLHDTIKALNRFQRVRALRFRGDGTGRGIVWDPR